MNENTHQPVTAEELAEIARLDRDVADGEEGARDAFFDRARAILPRLAHLAERKAYCINTDNFTAALAELIRVYQSETLGMEYRCKCHDGTIVTIRSGKPPKAKRAIQSMTLPTEVT